MDREELHHPPPRTPLFRLCRNQWRLFQKEDPPKVKPLLYVFRVLLTEYT